MAPNAHRFVHVERKGGRKGDSLDGPTVIVSRGESAEEQNNQTKNKKMVGKETTFG